MNVSHNLLQCRCVRLYILIFFSKIFIFLAANFVLTLEKSTVKSDRTKSYFEWTERLSKQQTEDKTGIFNSSLTQNFKSKFYQQSAPHNSFKTKHKIGNETQEDYQENIILPNQDIATK